MSIDLPSAADSSPSANAPVEIGFDSPRSSIGRLTNAGSPASPGPVTFDPSNPYSPRIVTEIREDSSTEVSWDGGGGEPTLATFPTDPAAREVSALEAIIGESLKERGHDDPIGRDLVANAAQGPRAQGAPAPAMEGVSPAVRIGEVDDQRLKIPVDRAMPGGSSPAGSSRATSPRPPETPPPTGRASRPHPRMSASSGAHGDSVASSPAASSATSRGQAAHAPPTQTRREPPALAPARSSKKKKEDPEPKKKEEVVPPPRVVSEDPPPAVNPPGAVDDAPGAVDPVVAAIDATSTPQRGQRSSGKLSRRGKVGGDGSDDDSDDSGSDSNSGGAGDRERQMWDDVSAAAGARAGPLAADGAAGSATLDLVSFDDALAQLRETNLTGELSRINTTSRGGGGLFSFCCGPPSLNASLIAQRNEVFALALLKFSEDAPLHLRMIQTVYARLRGARSPCARFGSHWGTIGFQGNDPATDLRGCGMLSILHMLFLFDTKYVCAPLVAHMFRVASVDGETGFPFAVVSIRMTKVALEALRDGNLNAVVNAEGNPQLTVARFYAATMYMFFRAWNDGGKTIAQYSDVETATAARAKADANRALSELQAGNSIRSNGPDGSAASETPVEFS